MKTKAILTAVLALSLSLTLHAQFGVSLAYSSAKFFSGNIHFEKDNNRFHFGASYTGDGPKDTVVKERKENYGLTKTGEGSYTWAIDLGYSRVWFDRLTINPEISLGSKTVFTNYADSRFSDGGYSLIDDTKATAGIGVNAGYIIGDGATLVEPFFGIHTMKNLNFGVRLLLNR